MKETSAFKKALSTKIHLPIGTVILVLCLWFLGIWLYACTSLLRLVSIYDLLTTLDSSVILLCFCTAISVSWLLTSLVAKTRHKSKQQQTEIVRSLLKICVCLSMAFLLECSFFQYSHYGPIWAGDATGTLDKQADWSTLRFACMKTENESIPELNFSVFFARPDIITGEADDAEALKNVSSILQLPENSIDSQYRSVIEDYQKKIDDGVAEYPLPEKISANESVVFFEGLDRKVSNVHIEPFFEYNPDNRPYYNIIVDYTDEANSHCQAEVRIVKDASYTENIPIYPVGKVSRIAVYFEKGAAFESITINETIPFSLSVLRILLVSLVFIVLMFFKRWNLLKESFDENSKRQKLAFGVMVFSVFAFCAVLAKNSIGYPYYETGSVEQYNHYLVDAILHGRVSLDLLTSALYENIPRSYDCGIFDSYGIGSIFSQNVHWDTVFYNGEWYSYFGIVPCLLLFVPYTALTGKYLPHSVSCFLFGCFAIFFLLMIWRWVCKKYLNKRPFGLYLLTSLTVALGSFVPFLIRRSSHYDTVEIAGLMFVAAGFWLLLKNRDKMSWIKQSATCLCMALAVGCRPTYVFYSLFVPILLWKDIRNTGKEGSLARIKLFGSLAIPYIIVAIPLMWYNYARFGSIMEFGVHYQVTELNFTNQELLHPLGKLERFITGIKAYLFNAPNFTPDFPFITEKTISLTKSVRISQYLGAIGMIWFPATWPILGVLGARRFRKEYGIIWKCIILSVFLTLFLAGFCATYCIQPRYEIDFASLMIMSGLASMIYYYKKASDKPEIIKIINRVVTAFCLFSCLMFFFLSFRGDIAYSPDTTVLGFYYNLKRAFSLFSGV